MSLNPDFGLNFSKHIDLGDKRLNTRCGIILNQLSNNIGCTIPQSAGNHSDTQAIYRFMNNPKVKINRLCDSSAAVLEEELSLQPAQTFLCLSDTSCLDYNNAKSREKLGCLGQTTQKGMYLHSLLLCNAAGTPQGLIKGSFFSRQAETLGEARKNRNSCESKKIPIEQKESNRWLTDMDEISDCFSHLQQHTFVHVMDAEGDMYELFSNKKASNIHFLTRLQHNRCVLDEKQHAKELVAQSPSLGTFSLKVKDEYSQKWRIANVELRAKKVTLQVPQALRTYQKDKNYQPLEVTIIQTKEVDFVPVEYTDKKGETKYTKPLEWFLITSLPADTFEEAYTIVGYYAQRWRVEDYHLVLKEGLQVEKLQFNDEPQLQNAIIIYTIIAIRVLQLRYYAKETPDLPIQNVGINTKIYEILAKYAQRVKKAKITISNNPTIKHFNEVIAILGSGNTKNDGVRSLWRGIKTANTIIDTYFAFQQE